MVNIFWFRRDLRIDDNHGLFQALDSGLPVLPLFIFDTNITDELPDDDARVTFIYDSLRLVSSQLGHYGSSILVLKGDPSEVLGKIITKYNVDSVYVNRDFEPYSLQRDTLIASMLEARGIKFCSFRDHVIFGENEIHKDSGEPYTVFTAYRNKWLKEFTEDRLKPFRSGIESGRFTDELFEFPQIEKLGFRRSFLPVKQYDLDVIKDYHRLRDFPSIDKTSYLGPHLRFGTVSIRKITRAAMENDVFLGELIWREFFIQILFSFPQVVTGNFNRRFNNISWRNDENEFQRWCDGETGYPIVDAGMRQLNATGYMHNRVRMITAGFLCKHLLIDWRWGEAYFAGKLLDYELSSNNGNWQWSAGTGCDAVPYFRVFNPLRQQIRFDYAGDYLNKWVPGFKLPGYTPYIVKHDFARERAISVFRECLRF